MRPRLVLLPLLLLLLARATGTPGAAAAQFPAELRGRVVDAANGVGVPGARVEEVGGVAAATGADGAFRLRGVRPGEREVRVRAFGYGEGRLLVEMENGSVHEVRVVLRPDPVALEGVEARGTPRGTPEGALVVGRAEIEASGARELGEVLEGRAGVVITRRGGPGAAAEVSLRGSSADQVLVLLDGVPLNSPLTGEADLSAVPMEAVERVTVLRGAHAARYGGRALAGVVSVETRRPTGEVSGRFGVARWGERTAAATAGGRVPRGSAALSGLVSAEWRAARGDFPYLVPRVRGGGAAVRENADAQSVSVLLAGGLESGDTELRARLSLFDVERGMPGSIVQPSLRARQAQRRTAGGVGARAELGGISWRAELEAQRQEARYRDPAPPTTSAYDERAVGTAVLGSLSGRGALLGAELSGGAETRRLGFSSTMLAEGAPEEERQAAAWIGGLLSRRLGGWAAELHPALRADWSSLRPRVELSPRVGAVLRASGWSARLAGGSGYSPPSLADQFFQEGVLVRPNPALRPERVRGEVEAALQAHDRPLGSFRVDAEAAAFRADVEGMILWFPDYRFVWQPDNYDVRRAGWEGAARLRAPWGAEIGGTLSHVAVEYTGDALSGQVAYRPRWSGSGSVALARPTARVELSGRYAGERRTVPGSALNTLPAHGALDLRATLPFRRAGWAGELSLGAENLLDQRAAMLIEYPYPGRAWSLSLRLRRVPAPPNGAGAGTETVLTTEGATP